MADKTTTRITLDRSGPFAPWLRQLLRHGRGSWGILAEQKETDVLQLPENVTNYLQRAHLKKNRVALRSGAGVETADLQDQWEHYQGLGVTFCFDTISRDLQVDYHEEHQETLAAMIQRAKELVSPVDSHIQTAMMRILHSRWTKGTLTEYVQSKEVARQRLIEAGGELSLPMLKICLADGVAGRKAYAIKVDILRSQMSRMSVTEVKRQLQRFEQEVNGTASGEGSDDTSGEEKSSSEIALLTQKVEQLMRTQNAQQQESARHTEVGDFQ